VKEGKGDAMEEKQGKPPKEWWDNCMSTAGKFASDAAKFCGWMWAHGREAGFSEQREAIGKDFPIDGMLKSFKSFKDSEGGNDMTEDEKKALEVKAEAEKKAAEKEAREKAEAKAKELEELKATVEKTVKALDEANAKIEDLTKKLDSPVYSTKAGDENKEKLEAERKALEKADPIQFI
jgi:hypothetical protein